MPRLERATRRRQRVPVGDLSELVFIENRAHSAPAFGLASSDFEFTPHESAAKVWANVETLSGVTFFDGVAGIERPVTHKLIIRFLDGISAQTWIRLTTGIRLDIVDVTTVDERDEFLAILAAAAGKDTRPRSGV